MKFHWGHKVALVYTLFAGFMIFMLIMSRQGHHQLVTENYYENELKVQDRIEASKNLSTADFDVKVRTTGGKVTVAFSEVDATFNPSGTIALYKPDDEALDETHALTLDEAHTMVIQPKGEIGRYTVQLSFTQDGTDYYLEKEVLL